MVHVCTHYDKHWSCPCYLLFRHFALFPPFPLHTPTPTQSIPNPFISSSLRHLSICAVHTNLLIHLLHTSAHLLHTSAHLFPSDPHSKLVFSTHIHQSHTHTPPPPPSPPHTHTYPHFTLPNYPPCPRGW